MIPVLHVEPYRRVNGNIEFLIVKRTPQDGGFWQPITGGIEDGEEMADCLLRELAEETGITEFLHLSDEICRQNFSGSDGTQYYDVVYAVEVHPETVISLNPDEHEDHRWLPLEEAINMLKWDGNKAAMRTVHQYILLR